MPGIIRRETFCSLEEAFTAAFANNKTVKTAQIEFGEMIGEGATSQIFKSEYNGQKCAAKCLRKEGETTPQDFLDLMMEIRTLSIIGDHPQIVGFLGASFDIPQRPIMLLELMDGQTLESYLGAQKPDFNLGRAVVYDWSIDLLSALHFLHDRDPVILHRDIKPANLLLNSTRTCLKLSDFGLAKPVLQSERHITAHRSNTGTRRYMAPEVLSNGNSAMYTEKADVYSASLVMFYLITGRKPAIDPRQDPHGRPVIVLARWRCPRMALLLENMWMQQPEVRPSAGECLRVLRRARDRLHAPSPVAAIAYSLRRSSSMDFSRAGSSKSAGGSSGGGGGGGGGGGSGGGGRSESPLVVRGSYSPVASARPAPMSISPGISPRSSTFPLFAHGGLGAAGGGAGVPALALPPLAPHRPMSPSPMR